VEYFSEREGSLVPRDKELLTDAARDGIGVLIRVRAANHSFALDYPIRCNRCSHREISRSNEQDFWDALGAVVPELKGWPRDRLPSGISQEEPLSPLQIYDAIEFCYSRVAKPREVRVETNRISDMILLSASRALGDAPRHIHLSLDKTVGRKEFREDIEEIFRRNGMAYQLTEEGRVERLLPPEFDDLAAVGESRTEEDELDRLLNTAWTKFRDPSLETRREALEALWDAWERLKTTWPGRDKKAQAAAMLNDAAGTDSPKFLRALEKEASELTLLGNNLRIRHSETTQEILATSEHVDYMFLRMSSLIRLILSSRQMVGVQT